MLDENMRILAGLQEGLTVENPFFEFLAEEENRLLLEEQRILGETRTVLTHFNLFREKMQEYNKMFETVLKLFDGENTKSFIAGIQDEKYEHIKKFAELIINDSVANAFKFLDENYDDIFGEITHIMMLNEVIDEMQATVYFVSQHIDESDGFKIFSDALFENNLDIEIPYSAQLLYISESLTLVKFSGKKFFAKIPLEQLEVMERKGILI